MTISAIVAMSDNRVIGRENQLPWHMPADLKHFKSVTMGHTVLMGRKTFESIGKPLPNRKNLILTRQSQFSYEGCTVVHSLDEALLHVSNDLFIIGGASLYDTFLPKIQQLFLTVVHTTCEGDAFFPALDLQVWHEVSVSHYQKDDKNPFDYSFYELVR